MLRCGGCSGGRRIASPLLLVCAILLSQGVFGLRRASKKKSGQGVRNRAAAANGEIGDSKLLAKDKGPFAGITARPHEEFAAESERQAVLADESLPSLQKQALADVVEQMNPEDVAVEPAMEAHADRSKALADVVEQINSEDAAVKPAKEAHNDRSKVGAVENFMQSITKIAKDELKDAGDRHALLSLGLGIAGICVAVILTCFVARSERAVGQEGGILGYAFVPKRLPRAFNDTTAAGNARSLSHHSAFTDVSEVRVDDDDSDTEAWHSSGDLSAGEEQMKGEADGKPDFTGDWVMTRYEGDFDAFLKDVNTSWLTRKAAGVIGYGVGTLHHIIKVTGDHFSIENKSPTGGYVREFKADGRDHDGEELVHKKALRLVAIWEEVGGRMCLKMDGYVKDPQPDDAFSQVPTVRRWLEGSEMAVELIGSGGASVISYFSKVIS